ncbi:MAG: YfhO family protein, partial [Anaerostipes hadrus]
TKAITEVKKTYQKNVETRMELVSGRMLDESIWHTLNGMTLFGSTAQGNVVDMMDQLGFYTGVNEYLYEGATPFTNDLFSMKYQIYRPYDTKRTEFKLKESVGNVTVYKNTDQTALAYAMDNLVKTWDYQDYNPFYVQNDLAMSAFDVDELFHMIETKKPKLNDCKITSDNGDGEYVFKNSAADPDNMVFTIKSSKVRELYVHFDGSQVEHTVIEKNGEEILNGRLDSQIIYLGRQNKGDTIKIRMQLKQDDVMSGVVRLTAAELDEDVMKELAQRMQENAWELTSAKGNQLNGTINAQEDKTLFFSIPYDKGWKVKIDGKAVKTKALGKAFLTVKVPEGKHEVTLTYVSPGFKEGAVLSIVGFVIFLLILYLFRKKKISNIEQNSKENYDILRKETLPQNISGNNNKEE